MAYLVIKKIGKKHYIYAIQSYREGGKIKKRQKYVGKASQDELWAKKMGLWSKRNGRLIAEKVLGIYKNKLELEEAISKNANKIIDRTLETQIALAKFPFNSYSAFDQSMILQSVTRLQAVIGNFANPPARLPIDRKPTKLLK